ncbi:MAG: ribosomal protein S18-alanine N-acetyltransferase [Bacilli bacterium]|nr:ribosomal protein S18-alanine N-acetyltransferase [Bacilli bacterium]
MKYEIREMNVDDIYAVIEGEEEVFGKSLGFDFFYQDLKLNPFAYYFVLDINGSVEGYFGIYISDYMGDIINFYVRKKYQKLGFGGLLLDFIIELCEMSNCKSISLEVRKSNTKAICLYEKRGFVVSRMRKSYYDDGEDAVVYIKYFEVKDDSFRG